MAAPKMNRDNLVRLIAKEKNDKQRKVLQEMLDKIDREAQNAAPGEAQVRLAQAASDVSDPNLSAILAALQSVLSKQGSAGGSVDSSTLRKAVLDEMARRRIAFDDLSDDLKAMLDSYKMARPVVLKIEKSGLVTEVTSENKFLSNDLAQKMLSDLKARNNVYLYGPAGSGKTYAAEQIASIMGWKPIVINCNQFTSPLEIIGGQTIDGYQEGKLSIAWKNFEIDPTTKVKNQHNGCVLILDELPKIDPNTAGLLNEALAKMKSFRTDENGNEVPPKIMNGKNEVLTLGNLFVIATGNVPLNTIDPDYEANFKQDLSLQDRFVGSCYYIGYDPKSEFEQLPGLAFIFNIGMRLRKVISELRATSQGFVSRRLLMSMADTYIEYRSILEANKSKTMPSIVSKPKTLMDTIRSFIFLFKEAQRPLIAQEIKLSEIESLIAEKNKMPFDRSKINFDTPKDLQEAKEYIKNYELEVAEKISLK